MHWKCDVRSEVLIPELFRKIPIKLYKSLGKDQTAVFIRIPDLTLGLRKDLHADKPSDDGECTPVFIQGI